MPQTVEQVLQDTTFYTDNVDYVMCKLHPRAIVVAAGIIAEVADPFCTMIVDKDEVTLIIQAELASEFGNRLPEDAISTAHYRLITLDMELEPDLVGLMAAISRALAHADVTIMPLAAYSRDHLLVPAAQFDTAMNALNALKS